MQTGQAWLSFYLAVKFEQIIEYRLFNGNEMFNYNFTSHFDPPRNLSLEDPPPTRTLVGLRNKWSKSIASINQMLTMQVHGLRAKWWKNRYMLYGLEGFVGQIIYQE